MTPEVLAFIDESGNTGDDLDHPDQRNLFLACLLVPTVRAQGVFDAVTAARQSLGGFEFHATDVYGGKNAFKNAPNRVAALEQVADSVIDANAYCFWVGLTKAHWKTVPEEKRPPLWKGALCAFLGQLHHVVELLYPDVTVHVVIDENTWVGHGQAIVPPPVDPWPRFTDGVAFVQESKTNLGLQAADFLAHTLYRANKNRGHASTADVKLSNTDLRAVEFIDQLAAAKRLFPIVSAVKELSGRAVESASAGSP